MTEKDKLKKVGDILLNNAMYIIIAAAVVYIAIMRPAFIKLPSIVNILSLTAAKLPIALGIGGCIVLTGTDISAGRVVPSCRLVLLQSPFLSSQCFNEFAK